MNIVKEPNKVFFHQLTDHFPTLEHLKSYIAPFKQYRETSRAVIVNNKEGFAIYTDGTQLREVV